MKEGAWKMIASRSFIRDTKWGLKNEHMKKIIIRQNLLFNLQSHFDTITLSTHLAQR